MNIAHLSAGLVLAAGAGFAWWLSQPPAPISLDELPAELATEIAEHPSMVGLDESAQMLRAIAKELARAGADGTDAQGEEVDHD